MFSGSAETTCITEGRLTFEPLVPLESDLENDVEGRTVVVRPVVVGAASAEVLLFVIGGSLRSVYDPVMVLMLFIKELGDLAQIMPALELLYR